MEFDNIIEEQTRKITQIQRYPRSIEFTPELLRMLEEEYYQLYKANESRKFHSNFLKALDFKLDDIKYKVMERVNKEAPIDNEIEGEVEPDV